MSAPADVAHRAAFGLCFAAACTTTVAAGSPWTSLLAMAASLLALVQVLACLVYMAQVR